MSKQRPLELNEKVVLAAIAMIMAHVAFRAWATAGSWFYSDDFIFLGTAARGGDTGSWLLTPHNIHFMPFALWLTTWVGHLAAFSWWAAALQIIVMQALAAVACWWMLRTLFGDRPGILVALGVFLISPATITTDVWWAAAINQLPHQIALFGAVAAHVTYLRRGTWGWALITGAFLVLGYASYTKTLLLPVLLLAITFIYFARGPFVARLRETLGRHWHSTLVIGGLTLAYVWLYLTVVPRSPIPQPGVLFTTIDLSVVRAAVPSLLGGPWNWQSLGQPGGVGPRQFVDTPLMFAVLSWGLIIALLTIQSLRYRRAWWPGVIVIGYAVLSAGLIAAGRATAFGPEAAAFELRYFADLAAVAALGVGLALMPIPGARGSLEPRDPPILTLRVRARWPRTLMAIIVIGATISSVAYVRPWHSDRDMPQRTYVAQVRSETAAEPARVADISVPDVVLWNAAFPASLASRTLAPLGDRLRFVTSGTDLQTLNGEGRLVDAFVDGGPRNLPGPKVGCGYPVSTQSVRIPVAPVINFPFWLTIGYLAGQDGRVKITAGTNIYEVEVKKGLHTAFVATKGAYDAVIITPIGSSALCVDGVTVGQIIPGLTP